jgi:N-carbamoyl-L-amino-acid hydrolase
MVHPLSNYHINEQRFKANFDALSKIGATAEGGVNRPALSEADLAARNWLRERIETAGLEYTCDSAGNQAATLRAHREGEPHFLLGSHLDTVPEGGCFDGALGILAALEVLQTIQEAGYSPSVNFEAVNFTDEEGTHIGLLGSRALTGKLSPNDLLHPNLGIDAFDTGLSRLGLTREGILSAFRDPKTIAGYLELHIEQGPILAENGDEIGIVTGIIGIHRSKLCFVGKADHAGTTPLLKRRDAGRAASAFAAHAWETVQREFMDCVFNVGNMRFEPGIFNVVPAVVTLDLELRSPQVERLSILHERLLHLAHQEAKAAQTQITVTIAEEIAPAYMNTAVQSALQECAHAESRKYRLMPSGAGHDAQSFAHICPSGMIFIPSQAGTSHSSKEFSRWQDCVNGANLLLQAAIKLAVVKPFSDK